MKTRRLTKDEKKFIYALCSNYEALHGQTDITVSVKRKLYFDLSKQTPNIFSRKGGDQ